MSCYVWMVQLQKMVVGGGGGGGAWEGQLHYQNHAPFSVSILSFCAYKNSYFFFLLSELRSCVKVDVDVLGSPSLISLRFLWT